MTRSEAEQALAALESRHVAVRSVHFHLRSNVCDVRDYDESIQELGAACRELRVAPEFLDIGGGFPTPGSKRPGHPDPYPNLTRSFSATAELAVREFPQIQEIWMENGRFLTGRSAVLVMTVLDEKWRRETRFLVCDGGRTNHALVSDWEDHSIWPVPERTGEPCWTTVVGPTCMAFDRLARAWLPRDIRVGDALVWTEAGAYHLPWETRFSHGHAPVFWYAEGRLTCARARGSFEDWWRCWR
jgi:diaminopimelate decarboxylase